MSYTLSNKIWLKSKYIKTKQKQKLKAKFFRPSRILHPVSKQAYKLKLPKQWRIYNVFYILLLKQNTTKKEQVDKKVTELKFKFAGNSKEYKMKAIWKSAVYGNKTEDYLPSLYYLVA